MTVRSSKLRRNARCTAFPCASTFQSMGVSPAGNLVDTCGDGACDAQEEYAFDTYGLCPEDCSPDVAGMRSCPCIGLPDSVLTDPRSLPRDCAEPFATTAAVEPFVGAGQCVVVTDGFVPATPLYPGDYGRSCKRQLDPADSDCYNQTTGTILPLKDRADWCDQPWCYIDPDNCDLTDDHTSRYWSSIEDNLAYSYSTCGGTDLFTQDTSWTDVCGDGLCSDWELKAGICHADCAALWAAQELTATNQTAAQPSKSSEAVCVARKSYGECADGHPNQVSEKVGCTQQTWTILHKTMVQSARTVVNAWTTSHKMAQITSDCWLRTSLWPQSPRIVADK